MKEGDRFEDTSLCRTVIIKWTSNTFGVDRIHLAQERDQGPYGQGDVFSGSVKIGGFSLMKEGMLASAYQMSA